jgi:hypothetical protein
MKSKSIRVAALPALMLAGAALTFAAGPGRVFPRNTGELGDRSGVTRAVQQGKGTLVTRNDKAFAANAYREQTTQDSAKLKEQVHTVPPSTGDPVFRK